MSDNNGKSKGSTHTNENSSYRGDGAQTPTYKKPAPMPPVKPAKNK